MPDAHWAVLSRIMRKIGTPIDYWKELSWLHEQVEELYQSAQKDYKAAQGFFSLS